MEREQERDEYNAKISQLESLLKERDRKDGMTQRLTTEVGCVTMCFFCHGRFSNTCSRRCSWMLALHGFTLACLYVFSVNFKQIYSEYMVVMYYICLLYTSPSPRDRQKSRMPSSA